MTLSLHGASPARTFLLLAVLVAAGCDRPSAPVDTSPPAPGSASARVEVPAPIAAAPGASARLEASAAPAASAAAASPSLAGAWEGTFEAKKGSVTVPAKVKDKGWDKDDGTVAVGHGTVELTISPAGDVRGRLKGALGSATLTGKAEDKLVRASVLPDDPVGPRSMTGVIVGLAKGEAIHAEIRVAGPDALLVREAVLELHRK